MTDSGTEQKRAPLNETDEEGRLEALPSEGWRRWGPYLAERAWGTVREDYSANGDAWNYFPHDEARSRVYRWNEDGLGGICDDQQQLCFALALWNERDPILKERLFGLSGPQGNHGEDVKEVYYYLDSTPTHSYMKMLYRYPQAEFPYAWLLAENARRGKDDPEFELADTGIFDERRFFDISVEYAKATQDDICIRITATNQGPVPAPIHLLPTLWFRNTWSWGYPDIERPSIHVRQGALAASHAPIGDYRLFIAEGAELLFTENETNAERLFGAPNPTPYVKDAFHRYVIGGEACINPELTGTKAAAHYQRTLQPGESWSIALRLCREDQIGSTDPMAGHEQTFRDRVAEADAFYAALQPVSISADLARIQRQAFAGLLWSKQFYNYDVARWINGDPSQPPPPRERAYGRNSGWEHLNNADVISMPDKWEYPWYAAWDLAFHCLPLSVIDPEFAKSQLILILREWYLHPNGQVPAYEWSFSDVNPPVLAWAAWRVYKIDERRRGRGDTAFIERVFHKLLLNFTWWVNRKDAEGHNVFQGGFLGLDNIGVFDRSAPLPTGGHIEQSDGTSWMAMFSLNMLTIALELARTNPVYEDIATKFFEHFMYIAGAMNNIGSSGVSLWDDEDEFFYDVLHIPEQRPIPLRVRSVVGLIPLLAVETIEPEILAQMPGFRARLEWFLSYRPDLAALVSRWHEPGLGDRRLLALVRGHRFKRLLRRALDEAEFLTPYGIRSLSRFHAAAPYIFNVNGSHYSVDYEPAESRSGLFGGNSNWRGPIWFPINYLLIEALQKFHHYYGDDFKVEAPTGSGQYKTINAIANDLSKRLIMLFLPDDGDSGQRPFNRPSRPGNGNSHLENDPLWRDAILFHEYFHGETGAGLGASHQTGWTGLVAKLIQQQGEHEELTDL